jgi:hypothetical protein
MQKRDPHQPAKCDKGFPKPYREVTTVPDNGYPLYRRRRNTPYRQRDGTIVDSGDLNARVVPYNPFLSLYFEAHINVEIYNTDISVSISLRVTTYFAPQWNNGRMNLHNA